MSNNVQKNLIIGIGGTGRNIVNDIVKINPDIAEFIVIDRAMELKWSQVVLKFGLGEYKDWLRKYLNDIGSVSVVASIGGKTGTKVAIEVIKILKKACVPFNVNIIYPFKFEEEKCNNCTKTNLIKIREQTSNIRVYFNDNFWLEGKGDVSLENIFERVSHGVNDDIVADLLNKGRVGIFWYIEKFDKFVFSSTSVENGEIYGDAITYPLSHEEFWDKSHYRKLGEYIDYPRGRVVYFPKTNSFVVYADERIIKKIKPILLEKGWFSNFSSRIVLKKDAHYRKTALF